ncbi:MAG: hypothetical protein BWZ01_03016 [Deltaproteobacteria bacterium ADurb.BinA179]|nr:MAG: hypothetical protein BWZ01_03016 [Deltaproteobacteria bacterium ADurb.BinA179]
MEHEGLRCLSQQSLHPLLIPGSSECGRGEGLCLSPRKKCRAMRSRQYAHLAVDGSDVIEAPAVDPDLALFHDPAHNLLFGGVKGAFHQKIAFFRLVGELFQNLRLEFIDQRMPLLLRVRLGYHAFDPWGHHVPDLPVDFLVLPERCVRNFGLARLFPQLFDGVDNLKYPGVSDLYGIENGSLGKLARFSFNHDDGVARPHDHEFHLALFELGNRWIDHELSVDQAYPCTADGAAERYPRYMQRRGCSVEGEYIRRECGIGGEYHGDDLGFVAISLRKQGPDRPVYRPGGKYLLGARPPVSFDESPLDPSCGIAHFLIVHYQGKEIHTLALFLCSSRGYENHAVSLVNEYGAVRLPGDLTYGKYQRCAFASCFDFHSFPYFRRFSAWRSSRYLLISRPLM